MNPIKVKLPQACLTSGFQGYEESGLNEPSETTWYRHCAERLGSIGLLVVQQHSTLSTNGAPDKLIVGNCGPLFIEFKARLTDGAIIRENQVLAARDLNTKTFYGSGRLCCFVYAMPNILGVVKGRKEVVELAKVDALSNPTTFTNTLYQATCAVVKGTTEKQIDDMIDGYRLQRATLKNTYRVSYPNPLGHIVHSVIRTYSPGLALRAVTGLDYVSALSLGDAGSRVLVEQLQ